MQHVQIDGKTPKLPTSVASRERKCFHWVSQRHIKQINDNILSLEKKIREAFACGQKLMTVFFDIDTYGTT